MTQQRSGHGLHQEEQDSQYVILCRHGPFRSGALAVVQPDEGPAEYPSSAVGVRLRETLKVPNGKTNEPVEAGKTVKAGEHMDAVVIHIAEVIHARSVQARLTAELL